MLAPFILLTLQSPVSNQEKLVSIKILLSRNPAQPFYPLFLITLIPENPLFIFPRNSDHSEKDTGSFHSFQTQAILY